MIAALLYSTAPIAPPVGLQDLFIQYGPVGALAGLGLWFILKTHAREIERADREAARADRAEERSVALLERVLPVLQDSVRVTSDATQIMREDRRRK